MKLTKFQINEDPIFQGFSDGSTWNGWSNPYFTLEVAKEVLNYYQNQECIESRESWLNWDLKPSKQFMGIDLYCFGFGFCWDEVTKEEEEKIDLINKVIDNCKKDDEYLRDIVNEYFQELETTCRGLEGIKETLEERDKNGI
tara:strand:+ start:987 stop:1412 length:426 start_codon:yes stop_codon:yes gene_type:complete